MRAMAHPGGLRPGADRRTAIRAALRTRVELQGVGTSGRGQALDVSEGGLLVRTELPLSTGARVQVEFALPDDAPGLRRRAVAEVAWASPAMPGVGLRFLGLPPTDRAEIVSFVDRRALGLGRA